MGLGLELAMSPTSPRIPGGADRADPVEVGQAAAGRGDHGAQLVVAVFEVPVESDAIGEQLGREPPTGAPGDAPRADAVAPRVRAAAGALVR